MSGQMGQSRNDWDPRSMYLKKIDGPRAVNLPDGSVMTRADLPPVETRRWVASRKAAVVKAVVVLAAAVKAAVKAVKAVPVSLLILRVY